MQAAKMTVMHLPASLQVAVGPKITAAFMDGFHRGSMVAAGTALIVAVVVFCYLPSRDSAAESELVYEH